jgi:sterol desaturase/sphingolipid hydroxylase (fatty acid hydroxylase superfamily)
MIPDRYFAAFDAAMQADVFLHPLIGICVFFLLEHIRPAKPVNYRGFFTNVKISLIFGLLLGQLISIPPLALANDLAAYLSTPWRIPMNLQHKAYATDDINITPVFPLGWLIFYSFVGLLIIDFFQYWVHRISHNTSLWGIHKVHHSDEHLCSATTYRHHPLNSAITTPLQIIPMAIILDYKPAHALYGYFILLAWSLFLHSNLRVSFGWLTPIISGPQLHRIHHSIEPQHQGKNFAAFFPIWDIIFSTYCAPKKGEYPDTGVKGEPTNPDARTLLYEPFRVWFSSRASTTRATPAPD